LSGDHSGIKSKPDEDMRLKAESRVTVLFSFRA
jgi:hypothetical protein